MVDQHRPVLSPDTLTRLAGAMPEFAAAWAGDVNALRATESELVATKALLVAANLRIDDLKGDVDAALADNNRLNVRNAYLEAQVQTFADRARDAEHGMAAIAERAGQVVRGDGTTRNRAAASPPAVADSSGETTIDRVVALNSLAAAADVVQLAPALRPVRELHPDTPDGTDLSQEPPPIARTPLPEKISWQA